LCQHPGCRHKRRLCFYFSLVAARESRRIYSLSL